MITPSIERVGEDNAESARLGAARVRFSHFRNYGALDVELGEGFNVLTGANAQGKTNFLEGLYLLSTTRLLRGHRDAEAVQEGFERANVEADLLNANTSIGISLEAGIRKRATLNGLGLPRAADLLGRLPAVSVSACDLDIVRGEPADRRMFMDVELSTLSPAYLRHLSHYKRALEHRNALLREARETPVADASFDVWEAPMAKHGAAIRASRLGWIEQLRPLASAAHAGLASGETLSLSYVSRDPAGQEEELLAGLGRSRGQDIARGSTSLGPHRDDISIEVGGRDARLFASQGQQRTAMVSLKMGTMELARIELGSPPLLLLDDIFSDLDARRRSMLVERVADLQGQAVLTCTESELAGDALLSKAKVFTVVDGKVTAA